MWVFIYIFYKFSILFGHLVICGRWDRPLSHVINLRIDFNVIILLRLQENTLKEFTDELKKQSDEMRKLKAIIVKHENRIRSLEAAQKAREEDVLDTILYSDKRADNDSEITKTPSAGNLAPDEV